MTKDIIEKFEKEYKKLVDLEYKHTPCTKCNNQFCHCTLNHFKAFIEEDLTEMLSEAMKAIPEEIIINGYIARNHEKYDNKACEAWNDCRNLALTNLSNLKTKK